MNSVLNSAIEKTSRELCIDRKTIEKVYLSYWKFIKATASGNPLKTMPYEEFVNARVNFNIPYIGKLYADYNKIKSYRKQFNYYQNVKNKKNQANRQSGSSD